MGILHWLYAKADFEAQNLWALASYPFRRRRLLALLEASMPSLSIETTNICNANCVFCAYQYQSRPQGVMEMALYHRLIDQYAEVGGGDLNLTPTVGEPLADSHIIARIRYARSKPQIRGIGMYSNLISLERFGAEALVESGLSSLTVSTSGLDEDMYRRVYRSKEYPRMLRNLKAFARANAAAGSPVDLFVDMRADRPAAEVFAFPDYKDIADLIGKHRLGLKLRYDNWGGKITGDQLSGNMKLRQTVNILRPRVSPCSELYSGPMVYWDGRIGACGCRDVDARELIIGDANSSDIAAVWLGPEIRALRSEFLTPKIRSICKSCTHYGPVSVVLRPDHANYLARVRPVEVRTGKSRANRDG